MTKRAGSGVAVTAIASLMAAGLVHCSAADPSGSLLTHKSGTSSGGSNAASGDDDAGSTTTNPGNPSSTTDGGSEVVSDASSPPPVTTGDGGSTTTPGTDASAPQGKLVAYASGYSPAMNVYAVDETTGALTLDSNSSIQSFGSSPSFLAVNPARTNLYAVDEDDTNGQVGAYSIDPSTGKPTFLNAVSSGGKGPPFVRVDATGKWVFVANYDDGSVSVLPVQTGGKLGAALSTINVGTNAHMMVPDPTNHFVFVPCLGSDYVAQFLFDDTTGALTANKVPHLATAAGAGPRHIAFHPNGKLAYLINETNSTMTALSLDGAAGTLTPIQTITTLPSGFTGTNTAAEVWVDPSGTHVFGSNRGANDIVSFSIDATGAMTLVGHTAAGGQDPRDFTLDATGTLLYTANQTSGNVVPFKLAAAQGTLTATAKPVTVTAASFIGLVRLPAQ